MADRIAVHGASGSGKTRLATELAERMGAARIELDAIFHQAGWTPLGTDAFRAEVERAVAGDSWVVDGNYRQVRDLVWERADLIVVLDLPRRTVMRQLVTRSIGRAAVRRELWNGNRESFRNLVSTNADRNVVLWSWRTLHRFHREVPDEARAEAPHARLAVLRNRADIASLVDALGRGDP